MSEITPEQIAINILEEAKNILSSRADLFIIANRRIVRRLFESSRSTADNQLLLLAFSFENFDIPFKEYYNRLFRKKLRESKLREKLLEKGLSEGGAIIVTTAVNELDVNDVIEIDGGIDGKKIREKINDRLKVLGDDAQVAFQELIHMIEVVLSEISKMGSEELNKIYEILIRLVKNNGIKAVRSALDEYIIEFDSRLRKEFLVS
jgi:hypothetical protein